MATVPGPPTCAPSSARSKLTALISAPAPKASTSPMSRPGHGRADPRSPPMTRDDAASAPHASAAAISLAPAGVHLRRHATAGALRLRAARRAVRRRGSRLRRVGATLVGAMIGLGLTHGATGWPAKNAVSPVFAQLLASLLSTEWPT